jgi:hypothetical protein
MADTEIEDWGEAPMNLSGTNATGLGAGVQVPRGFYQGVIKRSYKRKPGDSRITIEIIINAPGTDVHKVKRITGINFPKGDDDNIRWAWRNLLESVGFKAEALDKGKIAAKPGHINKKACFFFYEPEDRMYDGKIRDNLKFLSPSKWEEEKAAWEKTGGKRYLAEKAAQLREQGYEIDGGGASPSSNSSDDLSASNDDLSASDDGLSSGDDGLSSGGESDAMPVDDVLALID